MAKQKPRVIEIRGEVRYSREWEDYQARVVACCGDHRMTLYMGPCCKGKAAAERKLAAALARGFVLKVKEG